MTIHFDVHSLEETEQIANTLAGLLSPPDVVTLEGDLGAGRRRSRKRWQESWHHADSEQPDIYNFETIRRKSAYSIIWMSID